MENIGVSEDHLDPRIRRTRQMLRTALVSLLKEKPFDEISVQDISERSTVNRATFYDHYADKSALVEDLVRQQFLTFIQSREVHYDGSCPFALRKVILSLCDFLIQIHGPCQQKQRHFEPFVQTTIQGVLEQLLLEGFQNRLSEESIQPVFAATAASWAIYGATLRWLYEENRVSPEIFTESIFAFLAPIFALPIEEPVHSES